MRRLYYTLLLAATAFMCLAPDWNQVWGEETENVSTISLSVSDVKSPAESACDSNPACDPICTSCSSDRHWYANAEAVFLSRQRNQRIATFETFTGAGDTISYFSADAAGGDGMVATPRLTLGVQGECWGMDVRYWQMNSSQVAHDLADSELVGSIADSRFRAETIDIEVTRLFCRGETQGQFSFGVRYAQLDQFSSVTAYEALGGDIFSGMALSEYNFHGTGLTSALTLMRPIGCKNFNLFCSARASILWDNDATNLTIAHSAVGPALSHHASGSSSEANLFIGEIQLGGQWNMPLKCIPANAFIRGAFEYQYWGTNDSGGANIAALTGPTGGPYGGAYAESTEAYVNLVGFSVATGLTW